MPKNISEIFSEKRMASSPAKKKKKIHLQKHPCTKKTSPSRRLGRGRTGSQYSGSGAWLGLFALYLRCICLYLCLFATHSLTHPSLAPPSRRLGTSLHPALFSGCFAPVLLAQPQVL